MKLLITSVLLVFVASAAHGEDCQLLDHKGAEVASIKTDGAMARPHQGTYQFIGKSLRSVFNRRMEVFTNPSIVRRGSEVSCWMKSAGYVDDDGAVYDFGDKFIGSVKDDGKVYDRKGNPVGAMSEHCRDLPEKLQRRLVGGAALILQLYQDGDRISDYWLTFSAQTCRWP